jgi:hypothetical protein
MTKSCDYCGQSFSRPEGLSARRWEARRFCSQPCAKKRLALELSEPLETRFWAKVEKTDGCWLWVASTNKRGYGQISRPAEGPALAHRVSWELHFGPIPADLFVCHHCDTPPCVRPAHLFLGTNEDNVRDMLAKGRGGGPTCKQLSFEAVQSLRARAKIVGVRAAAREFGVDSGWASEVCRGKRRVAA